MPVSPAPGRQRQKYQEFKASLDYYSKTMFAKTATEKNS
jgi:hypothetical protein